MSPASNTICAHAQDSCVVTCCYHLCWVPYLHDTNVCTVWCLKHTFGDYSETHNAGAVLNPCWLLLPCMKRISHLFAGQCFESENCSLGWPTFEWSWCILSFLTSFSLVGRVPSFQRVMLFSSLVWSVGDQTFGFNDRLYDRKPSAIYRST